MGERVTVYYFHSTVRCDTCLMIEALADATIRAEFPNEMSSGTLVWRPLDVRLAENSHFVTDFGLSANELVVVMEKEGEMRSWKKIPEIWKLSSTPERMSLLIKDAISSFLEKR